MVTIRLWFGSSLLQPEQGMEGMHLEGLVPKSQLGLWSV